MSVVSKMNRPMDHRPRAGSKVVVDFADGSSRHCQATLIVSDEGTRIVLYHRGKAIDESEAVGWMPLRLDSEG